LDSFDVFGDNTYVNINNSNVNTNGFSEIRNFNDGGNNLSNSNGNKDLHSFIDSLNSENHLQIPDDDEVSALIKEATSSLNLCQMYMGWCPFLCGCVFFFFFFFYDFILLLIKNFNLSTSFLRKK
jgi:hypothetical protein